MVQQVSGVRCQVSGVRCQVSGVRCQQDQSHQQESHKQEVEGFLRPETCHLRPAFLRWRQSIFLLQTPLHGAEDQAVHHVAEDDNQNHYRHDLAHIAQVATHHQ